MSRKIVVTGRIPSVAITQLRQIDETTVWAWDADEPAPRELLLTELEDAVAAVTLLDDRVDRALLDRAPLLQVVANVAVGYNNIDVAACTERGVIVTNTPGVLTDATADLTLGLVLMLTRRLGEGDRLIRSGAAWRWGMFMMLGAGLRDRQLGIVGLGQIGTAVARRAKAFGLDVVYHNRTRATPATEAELGVRYLPLDELLATSDIVSLHCPYTPDTHHLIDAAALSSMQQHAVVVNTARGPIVDEAALVDALESGTLAGAALDVYEHEPEVHPGLRSLDNVVLTPHLGSATVETREAMALTAAQNVAAVLTGALVPNRVKV